MSMIGDNMDIKDDTGEWKDHEEKSDHDENLEEIIAEPVEEPLVKVTMDPGTRRRRSETSTTSPMCRSGHGAPTASKAEARKTSTEKQEKKRTQK